MAGNSVRGRRHWANGKPEPTFTEKYVVYGRCRSWDCCCSCRHCDDARAWRIVGQEGGSGRAETSPEGRSEGQRRAWRAGAVGKEQGATCMGERIGQAQSRVFCSEQSGCFKTSCLVCGVSTTANLSLHPRAGRAFRLGIADTSFLPL